MVTRLGLLLILFFAFSNVLAQVAANDCFDAQQIILPLGKNDLSTGNRVNPKEDLDVNLVYYQDEDEFTFWYKLIVKEDVTLRFKVTSTNLKDSYDFMLYRYPGDDFCNELLLQKVNPIKEHLYLQDPYPPEVNRHASYQEEINMKAGEIYYLAILNLTGEDCGHKLYLNTEDESLIMSAVHAPCFVFEHPVADKLIEKEEHLSPHITIEGFIKDEDNEQSVTGIIKFISVATGDTIVVPSSAEKGYLVQLKRNEEYQLVCESFGFDEIYGNIEFYKSAIYHFYLSKLKPGENLVLENVYFYPNTYAFKEVSYEELKYILNFMKQNEDVHLEIHGHSAGKAVIKITDPLYERKGAAWNFTGSTKKLSKMRADALKQYLIDNGVAAKRLKTKGWGDEQKIIPNPKTREENQRNMRVEVTITRTGK